MSFGRSLRAAASLTVACGVLAGCESRLEKLQRLQTEESIQSLYVDALREEMGTNFSLADSVRKEDAKLQLIRADINELLNR